MNLQERACLDMVEVPGSNPGAPTKNPASTHSHSTQITRRALPTLAYYAIVALVLAGYLILIGHSKSALASGTVGLGLAVWSGLQSRGEQ